jgi:hypothetical protein
LSSRSAWATLKRKEEGRKIRQGRREGKIRKKKKRKL